MNGITRKIVGVVAILSIVAVGIYVVDVVVNRPVKVMSFESVKLGMNMDEVAYSIGEPSEVLEWSDIKWDDGTWSNDALIVDKETVKKNKQGFKGYVFWSYPGSDRRIDVKFDKATKVVTSIGCYVDPLSGNFGLCAVNGISSGISEEQVIERLGQPTRSSIDAGSNVKTLEYDKFNMTLHLQKRAVYFILVRAKNS